MSNAIRIIDQDIRLGKTSFDVNARILPYDNDLLKIGITTDDWMGRVVAEYNPGHTSFMDSYRIKGGRAHLVECRGVHGYDHGDMYGNRADVLTDLNHAGRNALVTSSVLDALSRIPYISEKFDDMEDVKDLVNDARRLNEDPRKQSPNTKSRLFLTPLRNLMHMDTFPDGREEFDAWAERMLQNKPVHDEEE